MGINVNLKYDLEELWNINVDQDELRITNLCPVRKNNRNCEGKIVKTVYTTKTTKTKKTVINAKITKDSNVEN